MQELQQLSKQCEISQRFTQVKLLLPVLTTYNLSMAIHMDAATLQAALVGYQRQIDEIQQKMDLIRRQLGKPGSRTAKTSAPAAPAAPRRHRMSAEGRARIAAAQRARWAKAKRAARKEASE